MKRHTYYIYRYTIIEVRCYSKGKYRHHRGGTKISLMKKSDWLFIYRTEIILFQNDSQEVSQGIIIGKELWPGLHYRFNIVLISYYIDVRLHLQVNAPIKMSSVPRLFICRVQVRHMTTL